MWIFGGVALLITGLYFVFSGSVVRPPITEGLSDEEVASLPTAPEIGARAPDFTVADSNGISRSMSEFLGKPIAVVLFHTW